MQSVWVGTQRALVDSNIVIVTYGADMAYSDGRSIHYAKAEVHWQRHDITCLIYLLEVDRRARLSLSNGREPV